MPTDNTPLPPHHRLRETSNINRSLFTLGSVIEALARQSRAPSGASAEAMEVAPLATALEASSCTIGTGSAISDTISGTPRALHVPYRDSKLTRLLQV